MGFDSLGKYDSYVPPENKVLPSRLNSVPDGSGSSTSFPTETGKVVRIVKITGSGPSGSKYSTRVR